MTKLDRRSFVAAAAATAMAMSGAPGAMAQEKDDLVLGASIAITGVFAFAGTAAQAGIQDYIQIFNETNDIDGRKVRLVYEDTGYKLDRSIAAFNKITSGQTVHLYYGDSTAFAKTINPELNRRGDILMAGASFGSELNDAETFPYQFMAGPDYSEMVDILLAYIAQEKPGAKIVFVNSDTEFGRDPLERSLAKAEELGLEVAESILTPAGAVDVSTEVLKLRRARPDFTIFHGYVLAPVPEFITQARELGLETKFMGTFWGMDAGLWNKVGDVADGYMGVMPYRYHGDAADGAAPMMERIMELQPEYVNVGYFNGFISAMLQIEALKRTIEAGKEPTGENLKTALNSIVDYDTGGVFGVPISVPANSVPVGRVYQFSAAEGKMKPVSDWITIE